MSSQSEVAWRSDRLLPTRDPSSRDGLSRTGELGYVVGLDYFGGPGVQHIAMNTGLPHVLVAPVFASLALVLFFVIG